jgi:hypothetical protein
VSSLNVASPDCAEAFFAGRDPRCVNLHHAGSLGELRSVLNDRLAAAASPSTLDLIGHSTREHHLLRLGDTPIDMLDRRVNRFFRELVASHLLARLRISAVRLLGCETAVTDSGRRTMHMLAHTLRLPVFGTVVPLLKSHSGADGFIPAFAHLLIEAAPPTWHRAASPVPATPHRRA